MQSSLYVLVSSVHCFIFKINLCESFEYVFLGRYRWSWEGGWEDRSSCEWRRHYYIIHFGWRLDWVWYSCWWWWLSKVGHSYFIASEKALHLRESREVTREQHAKGDTSSRPLAARLASLAINGQASYSHSKLHPTLFFPICLLLTSQGKRCWDINEWILDNHAMIVQDSPISLQATGGARKPVFNLVFWVRTLEKSNPIMMKLQRGFFLPSFPPG